jgi:glycosyltransferase involved in cell wall biosynthesis
MLEKLMTATQNPQAYPETSQAETQPAQPPKLRVLFISHTYVVGVNQGKLAAIANAISNSVGLLAPARWRATSWQQLFTLEEDYSTINYFPANVFLNGRTGGYIYALGGLLKAFRQFQPNILQIEEEVFSLSTFQMAILARLTHTPLSVFGWENQEPNLSPLRRWMRRFVLDTAQLIVAGNQDGAELLRTWGYQRQIAVMPQMGVDMSLFDARVRTLPSDRSFRIGFLGRLVHQKGIDLIFEAAQQLKAKKFAFEIILCGSGQDEAELRDIAQQENVAGLVNWKGKVPHGDVPQEMAQFDVLVLPSKTTPTWKEQFGHVLIEAMSMGVPVIGSSSGEIPNVINRPDLVFRENQADELAQILERMMGDAAWYQAVSQYGIDRVQSTYTHERIAEQLIAHWNQILKTDTP